MQGSHQFILLALLLEMYTVLILLRNDGRHYQVRNPANMLAMPTALGLNILNIPWAKPRNLNYTALPTVEGNLDTRSAKYAAPSEKRTARNYDTRSSLEGSTQPQQLACSTALTSAGRCLLSEQTSDGSGGDLFDTLLIYCPDGLLKSDCLADSRA